MTGVFKLITSWCKYLLFSGSIFLGAAAISAGSAAAQSKLLGPDNPGELMPAIMHAYHSGAGQIVIPPGVYKLPEPTGGFYLAFEHLKNFRIIGKAVTLLRADPTKGGINFTDCCNVTLDGITLRCDPIPYTQGRILKVNRQQHFLDVRINAGYQVDLTNTSRFSSEPSGCTIFNPQNFRIMSRTQDINSSKVTKIGAREFRIYAHKTKPFLGSARVGELLAFRSLIREDIALDGCSDMCIQNVTIMAGTGFCYHEIGGGGNNRYINDSIVFPPKPPGATIPPLKASNADGLHSSMARHGPTVIGCHFEGTGDDGIAIHGTYSMLQHAVGRHWIVLLPWHLKSYIQSGDLLKLYNQHDGFLGRARAVTVTPLADYQPKRIPAINMGFDGKPPQYCYSVIVNRPIAGARYADRISDTNANGSGFIVRNCVIEHNRARGMIIKGDNGVIENNIINGSSVGGIEVAPEFWWNEAGSSCHLLIEGNTIEHVGYATLNLPYCFQAGAMSIAAHSTSRTAAFDHSGIAIIDNRFVDNNGINLLLADTQDVLVSGNRFINPMRNANNRGTGFHFDASNLIWMQQCKDVLLADNHVVNPGAAMKKIVGVGAQVRAIKGANTGFVVHAAGQIQAATPAAVDKTRYAAAAMPIIQATATPVAK